MAKVHSHFGAQHQRGATSNCPGHAGVYISCVRDPDDPSPGAKWICTHSTRQFGSAGSSSTGGSSGGTSGTGSSGKTGYFGLPENAFSKWSNGVKSGGGTLYSRKCIAMSKTPFFSTTIPCNPDAPGQVSVNESTTKSVTVSGSIGSGGESAVQASLGIDVSSSKTLTINQVFNGEKCRTFTLDIHVKYWAYEILFVSATTSSAFGVLVPVGWHPIKTPVPPNCCRTKTAGIIKNIGYKSVNSSGDASYALSRSDLHYTKAMGTLDVGVDYSGILSEYAKGTQQLLVATRNGVDCLEEVNEALDVADELASAILNDARDPLFVPGDTPDALGLTMPQVGIGFELLALAREYRNEYPGRAMMWYKDVCEYGRDALDAQRELIRWVTESETSEEPNASKKKMKSKKKEKEVE